MNHTCESQGSNVTEDPGLLGGHQAWQVALIVLVTGLLSFITILGNLLVVISFRVNHHLRTISNYYLLSLAVADLILGTVSMNLYTAYIIMGRWMLGNLACHLWLALDYVASNASVMNLLVISFDRYFSVTRPLTYRIKRTPRRAAVLITIAWAVSFVLWAPAILFWPYNNGQPSEEKKDCSIPFQAVPSLTFGTAIAAFYLPVCIMIILYWRIYWEIENRANGLGKFVGSVSSSQGKPARARKYLNSTQNSHGSSSERNSRKGAGLSGKASPGCFPTRHKPTHVVPGNTPLGDTHYREAPRRNTWNTDEDEDETSSTTEEEQEQNQKQSLPGSNHAVKLKDLQVLSDGRQNPSLPPLLNKKRSRRIYLIIREKKAARTLSTILLAFILTWTPYNIMVLASISYCVPEKLWQLGYWLCYVNSTVNPMCYALCNESFRATFKTLLQCRRGGARQREGSGHSHRANERPNKSFSTVQQTRK